MISGVARTPELRFQRATIVHIASTGPGVWVTVRLVDGSETGLSGNSLDWMTLRYPCDVA